MPELPDVEVFKRYIDATALHQTIQRVTAPAPKVLDDMSISQLGRAVAGRSFTDSLRWGKYLFLAMDTGQWLALHFGMTSFPRYCREDHGDDGEDAPFDAVRFFFDNGYMLAFNSRRKLGRIRLVDDPGDFAREQNLGPDALDMGEDEFVEMAGKARGSLKSLLMNQKHLSGLGNETSDEILFQGRWHPKTGVQALDGDQRRQLYRIMRKVLKADLEAGADQEKMPDWFLLPRRHDGEPCPRCQGPIRRISASGRSAYICPACQPGP
ncbi:formamidopyrimidine-DNA glycosylase [Marinobacter daqiaonensis]|uniref:Formamidopyrimidine-DNA glycosylase n=1 Tax=Marinobacter daqiaonensis TaxID=650891 RepID=A0A1I6GI95_9GAMM|nr:DNA-formamidopyrimidine glycosylase family protein [Marinobacter daqiaonensis]SFR41787.1 formamidopyrimidine-DNA glycosylase [Marinobacter daqiaonensis]